MTQYTISFLLTSAVMSAIILAILVFNMLFTKVFSARLRYAVWLVVLIGLIIPLRSVIGDGLFGVSLPAAAQTPIADTIHSFHYLYKRTANTRKIVCMNFTYHGLRSHSSRLISSHTSNVSQMSFLISCSTGVPHIQTPFS